MGLRPKWRLQTNAARRRAVAQIVLAACMSISLISCPSPCTADGDGTANASYDGASVEQWTLKLKDPDKQVRRRAAYALGQIGPAAATAVPALTQAADDGQLEVGWYALDALGRIGTAAKDAVPEMAKAAMAVTRLMGNNPRKMMAEDVEIIYKKAL